MTSASATSTATAMPSTTPRNAVATSATSQTPKSGRLTCEGIVNVGANELRRRGAGWAWGSPTSQAVVVQTDAVA